LELTGRLTVNATEAAAAVPFRLAIWLLGLLILSHLAVLVIAASFLSK
jgi:hypothetical protein